LGAGAAGTLQPGTGRWVRRDRGERRAAGRWDSARDPQR